MPLHSHDPKRAETIQELSRQLRRFRPAGDGVAGGSESSWPREGPGRRCRLRPATRRGGREAGVLATGILPLDRLLPEQGIRPGTLVEWLFEGEGSGAGTLAFTAASNLLRPGGACVVVDSGREFYPPAADRLGIDLSRTIVVRPVCVRRTGRRAPTGRRGSSDGAKREHRLRSVAPHSSLFSPRVSGASDLLWALEQSLRCPGVAVVVGWIDQINSGPFRRLALAAETGGGVGLLLRPAKFRTQSSWADVRLLVEPLPGGSLHSKGRRLRVELVYCRGRMSGGTIELEIDDETGVVSDEDWSGG